jgi:Tol biopolymer transport system component
MRIFQFFGKLSIVVFIVLVLLVVTVREFGTGRLLAYDHNTQIILADVDHHLSHPLVIEPRLLTNTPWSWSPDGQQLAFQALIADTPLGSPESNSDVYLFSMTDFQVRNLTQSPTNESGHLLVWSADGGMLALGNQLVSDNQSNISQFQVIDIENGQVIYQFSQPGTVTFPGMMISQDDITLTFVQLATNSPETQISVVTIDQQQVATQFSVSENRPWAGLLSPDGLWLSYQTTQDEVQTLWVMDTHTGEVHHVMDYAKTFVITPAWSPDSQYMAYSVWQGNEDARRELLYLMDIKTKQFRLLTNHAGSDSFPTWSPDGRWLAVISDRDHSPSIYLIDPLTGETKKVLSTHFPLDLFGSPIWSPDGQHLGLIVRNTSNEEREIYLVDIAGHSISYLAESYYLAWQP